MRMYVVPVLTLLLVTGLGGCPVLASHCAGQLSRSGGHSLQDTCHNDEPHCSARREHVSTLLADKHEQMVLLPGATFHMGTNKPVLVADGESPERLVELSSFWMDVHEVSIEQFQRFTRQSGYISEADKFGTAFVFEPMLSEQVLANTTQSVQGAEWWVLVHGANWSRPEGFDSSVEHRLDHPVTHVSWNDANEFCRFYGKRLPTEAEWEYACRGSLEGRLFPWGNKEQPNGDHYMNIWQGHFPHNNTGKCDLARLLVYSIGSICVQPTMGTCGLLPLLPSRRTTSASRTWWAMCGVGGC